MPEVVETQPELPLAPPTAPAARKFVLPDEPAPKAPEAPAASEPKQPAQNTGTEATPAKPEGDKPEEVTPEQAAKREGRRFERKLDKAYRRAAEAQARAELLEKQLAELRQPQAPQGEPKLEQFDFDPEKYAAAKAEYAKAQATKEFEAKQRTEAGKQATQKLLSDWESKVARAEDKYEDFADKVGDLKPDSPMVAAIMEADNGEEVAYFLGTNPKEAQRIAQLPPLAQAREIGKLEAKLMSKPVEPKAPSKAPAPIAPLSGAASGPTDGPSESDDIKAWIRKRQKQVHGRR